MSRKRITIYLFCVLSAVFNVTVTAATLMELAQADKVRIQTWVEPQENIIARQQVNLQIEIATDKWFSGGTRIGTFEVKDAIVGDLDTEPFRFVANFPEPFLDKVSGKKSDKTNWIATTRFDVKESFDKTFDDLKPGDAIVRSIRMSAHDLPAIMLPSTVVDKVPGIAVYAKPPQFLDKVNRGIYLAERTQVITYVFERPGQYQLPQQTFFWWNLKTQSLESIELEPKILTVHHLTGIGESSNQASPATGKNRLAELIPLSIKTGIVFLLVIVAGVVVRKLSKIPARTRSTQPARLSESALRKQFEAACRKNNLENAIGLFYQWLDNYGGKAFNGSVRGQLSEINQVQLSDAFENIMRTIYTSDQSNEIDLQ